jgi:hypothetical protein
LLSSEQWDLPVLCQMFFFIDMAILGRAQLFIATVVQF